MTDAPIAKASEGARTKLGSLGVRALLLFAAVGLVPVGVVIALLLSVNQKAVELTEQQLQAAVIDELKAVTMRHIEGVRTDAEAVALALRQAAISPPQDGGDGLDVVRAILGTRSGVDAVRFEVPERNVSTVIGKKGETPKDLPTSTPELRSAADERGMSAQSLGPGRGVLVVPIPPIKPDDKTAPRGYVTASLDLDGLQDEIHDIAGRRFSGSVGLAVVDAARRSVASHGMTGMEPFTDTSKHPLWAGFSETNPSVVGVGRVAPYREPDGTQMIGSIEWLPGLGWGVALARREEDAFEVLAAMRKRGLIVAIGAALFALAAAAFSARWVARPIIRLVGQARLIAERRWRDLSLASGRSDEIGQLTRALSTMATDLESGEAEIEKQAKQRSDLGRFLSKELVEAIVSGEHEVSLGGRRASVSVLFADVVAFTPLAESRPAEEVVALLNELFSVLTEVVFRHGGTVDKFIGDCLMAFWNAPLDEPDHALRAVRAGVAMAQQIERLSAELAAEGLPRIAVGVGINTGRCVVGNMGSAKNFNYTALGDAVNLAARLESASKELGVTIVIGPETARQVGDRLPLRELGAIKVKGKQDAIDVYTVAE